MESNYFGKLSVIGMKGTDSFVRRVDEYLTEWRKNGKGILHDTVRGHDIYLFCDPFNYGVTYKMYGQNVPMSPDDHFQDLKRMISAIGGKARRINVVMPMLYEGRQHRRSARAPSPPVGHSKDPAPQNPVRDMLEARTSLFPPVFSPIIAGKDRWFFKKI